MPKLAFGATLILGLCVAAGAGGAASAGAAASAGGAATATVAAGPALDLDDPAVLQSLERSSPTEFAKIERILEGLRAHPRRAESNWLQIAFHARAVDLQRYLFLTSLPPKQLLHFTLDNVRYRALVTRWDLAAAPQAARATAAAPRREAPR